MGRLHDNLRYLARAKNIKISDLEREMNVSNGYISRGKGLSLMSVYRASKLLGVSMEYLIEKDYSKSERIEAVKTEIERLEKELEVLEKDE